MGRKALTTLDEIEAAIREMDHPATAAEIAAALDAPRNRVNQRLNADDSGRFVKTAAGAYYPTGMVPMLLTPEQRAVVLTMREHANK